LFVPYQVSSNVAFVSGLSIIGYPFGFLQRLL